ncbi:helix-turn-helix transcriptional regulator [Martelella soudanensis]|uniref:helix-turn-helix transcriptional regulator n=1 Tax=unclassified Martelella TaxID=2629616 RepID=UPI0015DDBA68|nr:MULTISPECIES: LuxR family transcriptional regulator [unclassified Martelella]
MNKIDLVLENLVLVHEMNRVEEIGRVVANAAQGYGFSYVGLFRRFWPSDGDRPRWQPVTHWLNRRPILEFSEKCAHGADVGWSRLSGVDAPFTWDKLLEMARRENQVVYRKLKKQTDWAAGAGITHGITFPVFARDGLMGKLILGSDTPVDLSPVEVSLFTTLATQSLRQCTSILQRGKDDAAETTLVPRLSDRELLILKCIAGGMTSVETGKAANISHHTVDWYVNNLQGKLGARNRQNLVALAFRHGLVR